jgi:membrane protein required for beta-lactamase induction
MDWLLDRTVIISLAVVGGIFSALAMWCQARGNIAEEYIGWLNRAAYGLMAASVALFIAAGLLGTD